MLALPIMAALLVTGLLASMLAGVLGMGGGVLLLGVMTALVPAQAVVPVHGVVQLVSNATRTLALLRHVAWRVFLLYVPLSIVGVGLAASLWSGDKLTYLRPGIGVLLIVVLILRHRAPVLRNPPRWVYPLLGLVVGFTSVWIGATGPLLAPFFLRDDFTPEQVIATKAACQSTSHLLKIPAFMVLGFDFQAHAELLAGLVITAIVGTLVGRAILGRLNRKVFERLFEGLLMLLALWLIVGALV